MNRKSKKKKTVLIAILIAVVAAIVAVSSIVVYKMTNETTQVEKNITSAIDKYMVPADDLKEYAKVSDLAALQVKFSELRQITIVSRTEDAVTFRIIAPDLKPFFMDYLNAKKEITDYTKEMTNLDESIKQLLAGNDVKYIESIVSVPYMIADDNTVQIEETEEFYDAIYGGLLTFIKEQGVKD